MHVTVPALATVEALDQPGDLRLSTEDIARGYKDVPARYRVASNTGRGWLLHLSPRLREPQDLALVYRFVLASDARPGSYELPVHLSATPL